jgi:hypothetical protein
MLDKREVKSFDGVVSYEAFPSCSTSAQGFPLPCDGYRPLRIAKSPEGFSRADVLFLLVRNCE